MSAEGKVGYVAIVNVPGYLPRKTQRDAFAAGVLHTLALVPR